MSADGAKVNMTFVAAIVAVATIGGFMFGYDSGVINGTQEGLESTFNLSKLRHRPERRRDPDRLRLSALSQRAAWPTSGAAAR
jgi:hypothetical protein